MSALPITVCIPVLNEERNLPTCLAALGRAFYEVVVIDSGSTDATRQIARESGATLLEFHWNGGYPKKRNWALDHRDFGTPWVLFLDADERISPAFIAEAARAVASDAYVGYWISYDNYFMGRRLRHGDVLRKLALFRRDAGRYERFPEESWSRLDMEVHEHPVLTGPVSEISARIEHFDKRGLEHYVAKHEEYAAWEANRWEWLQHAGDDAWRQLTPRQKLKYRNLHKRWLSWTYFLVSFVGKRGFLDGIPGWKFATLKRRYFQSIRRNILERQRGEQMASRAAASSKHHGAARV
jgi:glycosyltransferase involved in cell wall biosynthesis